MTCLHTQNADPDVRTDMEAFLSQVVPEVCVAVLPATHLRAHSYGMVAGLLVPHQVDADCRGIQQHAHTQHAMTLCSACQFCSSAGMHMCLVQGRSAPWVHTSEGLDDMPAHIKASLFGPSLNIPITAGRLNLGTWWVRTMGGLTSLFAGSCASMDYRL